MVVIGAGMEPLIWKRLNVEYLHIIVTVQYNHTDLELRGPTLFSSYDELAVMAESGMDPECMPSSASQWAENNTRQWYTMKIT